MERLIAKYVDKLEAGGICPPGNPLMGGLDADLCWNRPGPERAVLEEVVQGLNINSILLARPAEPVAAMLDWLAGEAEGAIRPGDSETRTFLHEIPVCPEFSAPRITAILKRRKAVLLPGRGIVTFGTVSPEQAFVHFCSVCFAGFVKFFGDHLAAVREGRRDRRREEIFAAGAARYEEVLRGALEDHRLRSGPFATPEQALAAMIEVGRLTVRSGMVDSFFGNISYRLGDTILITQTTSSLDALEGCIDACPLDGSSTVGITASSEYSVHRELLTASDSLAILHGHPRFSVVMSLICDVPGCPGKGRCHLECPRERFVGTVPIVPGEAGTGVHGIATTLPPFLKRHPVAIVYGHGTFALGRRDFADAFRGLVAAEELSFREYLRLLAAA